MRKLYFKELKACSKSEITEKIGEENFRKLQSHSIIEKDADTYQFAYVGVIIISDVVINCYPKYFPAFNEKAFKRVVRVLKKYKNTHDDMDYQNDLMDDVSFSLLSMMIFFLEDYFEHGLYTNMEKIIQINGNGEIDWNRTVNYTDPVIIDNKPYYVELQTRHNVSDLSDYFRLLHECIITDASRCLEDAGLLELFDLTGVELSPKSLDEFGEVDVVLERLEKELNVEFVSRKRKLLKAMHTYIKEVNSFSNENYLTVYGTSAYHTVWEDICRSVFSDMLKKRYSNSNEKLMELIKKPKWILNTGKEYETDTFRPDLITIEGDEFIILDAKYYNLKFDMESLEGHSGLGDITKQYLYQLAFNEFIDEHDLSVRNALLFPKFSGEIENRGYVEIEILQGIGLENIQVVMLPADMMNNLYLENRKMTIGEYLNECDG